ncbi:MAG: glycosyltransferase [Chloroflexi bacterium]|nr:glycosyltransferase [Chloroflexota bacterium]
MRIQVILPTFYPDYVGGAEISALHTCRELQRRGMDIRVLVVNNRFPGRSQRDALTYDGLSVRRARFNTPIRAAWTDVFDARVFQYVRTELEDFRPDLVHAHNVSGATLSPYLACRAAGVRVVNTLHDLWLLCPNNMRYRRDGTLCDSRPAHGGCRLCFRRYDYWGAVPFRGLLFSLLTANVQLFISPSQALIEQHVRAGYNAQRFRMVPNGIVASGNGFELAPPDAGFGALNARRPTLVYAGGGIETKGAAVMLDALPIMLRTVDNLEVLVAGGGEERLLSAMRAFGPRVRVLGPLPYAAMRALFASADLTVTPSVWPENSPTVIYESFEAGTPVAGSRVGGIPELVTDGETGYLFPRGDAASLAATVIGHFALPAPARRRMRLRCLAASRTRFSMDSHIAGVLQAYREVMER